MKFTADDSTVQQKFIAKRDYHNLKLLHLSAASTKFPFEPPELLRNQPSDLTFRFLHARLSVCRTVPRLAWIFS